MKRMMSRSATLLGGVVLAVLAACTTANPDVIQRGDAQRLSQVADAVVLDVHPVVVEGQQSGVGGVAGAVAGSVAGGERGSPLGSILGAVVGGVVGNAAERYGTREQAVEILLQMSNGERRAVVQAQGSDGIKPGDAVILVTTGGKTRVMLAPRVMR